MSSYQSQAEPFGNPGKESERSELATLTTSDAPAPCSPDVVWIGTAFIHISNIVWENRAAASLHLAAKTMVPFNASFHKLVSSKHHIFQTRQSARRSRVLFLLHVMKYRET